LRDGGKLVTGRLLDRAGSCSAVRRVPSVVVSLATAAISHGKTACAGTTQDKLIFSMKVTRCICERHAGSVPQPHTSYDSTSERVCIEKSCIILPLKELRRFHVYVFCVLSCLFPLPHSAPTRVYVARAKVNVSRSFLQCHVIYDTHISTGCGVTSRVLTYQVT